MQLGRCGRDGRTGQSGMGSNPRRRTQKHFSILTTLSACGVQAGSKKRCAALPAQSFPRRRGRRATHPPTISVTHALWPGAPHSYPLRLPLTHKPKPIPIVDPPPLLSHQKFPPLTHSQARSRVIKPSAHGVGWSCREELVRGGQGVRAFPITRRQLLPSNRQLQPPGTHPIFAFQAKLNNPPNCALEMPTTSVLKPRL